MDIPLQTAVDLLRAARSPVVLTGAGVSKESGIATFREAQTGLWARYDPVQLSTAGAFEKNPALVWGFYQDRRAVARKAAPNPGHRALAALERHFPSLTLITQNIDSLHELAGSTRVVHLHGYLDGNKCSANCRGNPTPVTLESDDTRIAEPPPCPYCGAPVRPDIVWFGEMLPPDALDAAEDAIERADLMLIVGTSGIVYPAAGMTLEALRHGAKLIEVNPVESALTPWVDVWLAGPSGEVLPRLVAALDRPAGEAV